MSPPDDGSPQPPRRKRMTTVPPRVSTTTPGVLMTPWRMMLRTSSILPTCTLMPLARATSSTVRPAKTRSSRLRPRGATREAL